MSATPTPTIDAPERARILTGDASKQPRTFPGLMVRVFFDELFVVDANFDEVEVDNSFQGMTPELIAAFLNAGRHVELRAFFRDDEAQHVSYRVVGEC